MRLTSSATGDGVSVFAPDTSRLALALEGYAGIQLTDCVFPVDALPALEHAAAALITLTPCRALLATRPASRQREHAMTASATDAILRVLALGLLTLVTIQYSLVGTQPGQPACEVIHMAFFSPLLTPFRALRDRLSALLGTGTALGVIAAERDV